MTDDQAAAMITGREMYALLVRIDKTVETMAMSLTAGAARMDDHESRLRSIEASDVARRISDLEADIKAMAAVIEEMKRRLWAIPGASVVIAAAAVIITLIKTY